MLEYTLISLILAVPLFETIHLLTLFVFVPNSPPEIVIVPELANIDASESLFVNIPPVTVVVPLVVIAFPPELDFISPPLILIVLSFPELISAL